jgi:hypothetical protein
MEQNMSFICMIWKELLFFLWLLKNSELKEEYRHKCSKTVAIWKKEKFHKLESSSIVCTVGKNHTKYCKESHYTSFDSEKHMIIFITNFITPILNSGFIWFKEIKSWNRIKELL